MSQKIYGLTVDHGDGSAGIVWFKNKELVDRILDDELFIDEYYGNEGTPAEELEFPDGLDLEACGFRFRDNDILERLDEE